MPEAGNKRIIVRASATGPILAVFDTHTSAVTTDHPAAFQPVRTIGVEIFRSIGTRLTMDRMTVQAEEDAPVISRALGFDLGPPPRGDDDDDDDYEDWDGLRFEVYILRGNTAIRGWVLDGTYLASYDEDADHPPRIDEPSRESLTFVSTTRPVLVAAESLSAGDRVIAPPPQ